MTTLIAIMLGIAGYWNFTTNQRLEILRKHVNERLARLEKQASVHGWPSSHFSFGPLGSIDEW